LARIIRSDREGPAVLGQEVFTARIQARQIVERAESAGREMVARAAREAESLRAEAVAQGREQGRAEAAQLLIRAGKLRDQALAAAEKPIVQIAMAAAERIIGAELTSNPDSIARIVSPLLARARGARQVTIRVNPLDVEALQKAAPALGSEAGLEGAICVQPDPAMTRGGCVIATDVGTLEASIEVQLAALARVLGS